MGKTLIVGPAICELGWNLMAYNPHCRAIAKRYDRVVVCCPPNERYIWEFANEFYDVKKPDRSDRWLIKNGRPIKIPKLVLETHPKADTIVPNKRSCQSKVRQYKKFHIGIDKRFDITFHARATKKYNQGNRNWPISKFEKIVKAFPGLNIASIGTKEYSHRIPGTKDYRDFNIGSLCSIISSSKVVVGPSSGPMHLASLCWTPHVVWTYDKKERAIKGTNKERYEKIWNPFNTRVEVIDKYGWDPPVEAVISKINKIL